MEEDKRSWTCAGAPLLLWPAPGRLFPGITNQIFRCALDIAVHYWYPRTLTVHLWYPRTLTAHLPEKQDI